MRAPFRQNRSCLNWVIVQGEKVTLSPILLGLLRASASLWGIWLYRCPDGSSGLGGNVRIYPTKALIGKKMAIPPFIEWTFTKRLIILLNYFSLFAWAKTEPANTFVSSLYFGLLSTLAASCSISLPVTLLSWFCDRAEAAKRLAICEDFLSASIFLLSGIQLYRSGIQHKLGLKQIL